MKSKVQNFRAFLIERLKKLRRGFSLIELLVVIALFGILAALVLMTLGSIREKANDARIISNVSQLQIMAEIIYENNEGSYDNGAGNGQVGACLNGPTTDAMCTTASIRTRVNTLRADTVSAGEDIVSFSNPTRFCILSLLSNGQVLCVDNNARLYVYTEGSVICTQLSIGC